MIRILLTYLVPLLLPTALYLLWVRFALARGRTPEIPVVWLVAAGVILAAITAFALSLSGGSPGGLYQPPHVANGKVVPGHFDN